ncbi:MAG: hypothetical protein CVU07_11010 [Bacteroidetes bacterium HGW-Bacteroidetes-23]|nr:MAG: hypothetical protein CVU07_11010 [Bacteroidetes bacterium HGW-Bacteroidetes-23]
MNNVDLFVLFCKKLLKHKIYFAKKVYFGKNGNLLQVRQLKIIYVDFFGFFARKQIIKKCLTFKNF